MSELNGEVTVPAPTVEESGLSFKGLYEVIFNPTAFFEKLKNSPKILVPYLALMAVLLAFFFATADIMAQFQLAAASAQGRPVPPQAMGIVKISIIIGGTLTMMIAPLLYAALAMFWGNFVMAGKARFKQLLSVMLYGEFLYMLGGLAIVPLILYKKALVSLSLAMLLPADTPMTSWLYVALSKVGVFYVWELIVIGIGLSIMCEFERNKGYLVAVLSLVLLSVLHVLLALAGLAGS